MNNKNTMTEDYRFKYDPYQNVEMCWQKDIRSLTKAINKLSKVLEGDKK